MARHLPEVKLAAKQAALHSGLLAAKHFEPARRRRSNMRHNRHQIARSRMAIEDPVLLSPYAAMHGVQNAVTLSTSGLHKESSAHKHFSRCAESDVHGVIHATRHHDIEPAAVGFHTEDV